MSKPRTSSLSPFDASILSQIAQIASLTTTAALSRDRADVIANELVSHLGTSRAKKIGEALLAGPDRRDDFPQYAQRAASALESQLRSVEEKIQRYQAATIS